MSEMVLRVEAAIADVVIRDGSPELIAMLGIFLADHPAQIGRAAIEAMREPTNAMCEAAGWHQQSEVNHYQDAIDAALK